MSESLDRTQQRIVGALIEKELTVPDSYPLTENALLAACNQKSNRDPEMGLERFELIGAINALMTSEWVKSTTSTGGHAVRYAHRLSTRLPVSDDQKAVLCELLIRGPQAPGALKPRVARLGFKADAAAIEEVLHRLASHTPPLVEQLPRRPRERDHRWRHCLGPIDPEHAAAAGGNAPAVATPSVAVAPKEDATFHPTDSAGSPDRELLARIEQLEADVARLQVELRRLREGG